MSTGHDMKKSTRHRTGPAPARVKLDRPWEKAVGDALKKKRPPEGWPDQSKPRPHKKKPA